MGVGHSFDRVGRVLIECRIWLFDVSITFHVSHAFKSKAEIQDFVGRFVGSKYFMELFIIMGIINLSHREATLLKADPTLTKRLPITNMSHLDYH